MSEPTNSDIDPRTQRLEKLLEGMQQTHSRLGDQIAEFRAELEREPTTGQLVRQCFKAWSDVWGKRYRGAKYVFDGPKDTGIFKRLLKQFDSDVREIVARAERFIRSNDPFYCDARHPLALFSKSINRWGAQGAATLLDEPVDLDPVRDCRHHPPCKSDAEHTRRKIADMRATTSNGRPLSGARMLPVAR